MERGSPAPGSGLLRLFTMGKAGRRKGSLGEENMLYYNSELKRWVERGKEAEAEAAAAERAPPSGPASSPLLPVHGLNARRTISQRYVMQSNLAVRSGPTAGEAGALPALLPPRPSAAPAPPAFFMPPPSPPPPAPAVFAEHLLEPLYEGEDHESLPSSGPPSSGSDASCGAWPLAGPARSSSASSLASSDACSRSSSHSGYSSGGSRSSSESGRRSSSSGGGAGSQASSEGGAEGEWAALPDGSTVNGPQSPLQHDGEAGVAAVRLLPWRPPATVASVFGAPIAAAADDRFTFAPLAPPAAGLAACAEERERQGQREEQQQQPSEHLWAHEEEQDGVLGLELTRELSLTHSLDVHQPQLQPHRELPAAGHGSRAGGPEASAAQAFCFPPAPAPGSSGGWLCECICACEAPAAGTEAETEAEAEVQAATVMEADAPADVAEVEAPTEVAPAEVQTPPPTVVVTAATEAEPTQQCEATATAVCVQAATSSTECGVDASATDGAAGDCAGEAASPVAVPLAARVAQAAPSAATPASCPPPPPPVPAALLRMAAQPDALDAMLAAFKQLHASLLSGSVPAGALAAAPLGQASPAPAAACTPHAQALATSLPALGLLQQALPAPAQTGAAAPADGATQAQAPPQSPPRPLLPVGFASPGAVPPVASAGDCSRHSCAGIDAESDGEGVCTPDPPMQRSARLRPHSPARSTSPASLHSAARGGRSLTAVGGGGGGSLRRRAVAMQYRPPHARVFMRGAKARPAVQASAAAAGSDTAAATEQQSLQQQLEAARAEAVAMTRRVAEMEAEAAAARQAEAAAAAEKDELLLCLGQESSKVAALADALRGAHVDPEPLLAAVEAAFLQM